MKNLTRMLGAACLIATFSGILFGQNVPHTLIVNGNKFHQVPSDVHSSGSNIREDEMIENLPNENPSTSLGSISSQFPRESVIEGSGAKMVPVFNFRPFRGQQRMAKRYKLSFYDCIALYCHQDSGEVRINCILNSCNRARYWPQQ